MRHIDLFSGIGGFALAADWVWPEIEHVFCEIDPFCTKILQKHWKSSQIYADIKSLTADAESQRIRGISMERQSHQEATDTFLSSQERPYILTGGFPCQPFSQAGQRRGTEDNRYLWPEMLRVIRELQPRWVIAENVRGFVTWNDGMVLGQVRSDLENAGYETQSFIIPAAGVNAPHRRDRIWIVGNACSIRGRISNRRMARNVLSKEKRQEGANKIGRSNTHDTNSRSERRKGGGNKGSGHSGFSDRERCNQGPNWGENWTEVATRFCRVDDGIPRRMDRAPRLKALGNAIVPQVAAEIMRAIKFSEENI